jgi:hypothetical protein
MTFKITFENLPQEQKMAIRYHLRSSGFSGDHDTKCHEIANDANLLDQLTTAYRKYAGIK